MYGNVWYIYRHIYHKKINKMYIGKYTIQSHGSYGFFSPKKTCRPTELKNMSQNGNLP